MAPSTRALGAINAQNTGETFLTLLKMNHASFDAPLYFINDFQGVTSNGIDYVAWPFDLPFPEIGSDTLPNLTLTIDNIDQSIAAALKGILTPIDVTLQWVLRATPDTVEGGPLYLRMRSTEVGLVSISGSLIFEDLMNEPFPYDSYVPATAPGLF